MPIIKMVIKDIDSIMTLINEAVSDMQRNGIDQWDEIYPDKKVITDDIVANSLYGIRTEGNIAGIMALNEYQPQEYQSMHWDDSNGHALIVHRLCIHPRFQGRGLAKLLMQFAETYAEENNYTSIRLDAFIDNKKALGLYSSLKYNRIGIVKFRKGYFNIYEKKLH
jgi:ribosomal protein S18 acetylase RimI-like enzyme